MQFQHELGARFVVQLIDILGDGSLEHARSLQIGQRIVSGVGLRIHHLLGHLKPLFRCDSRDYGDVKNVTPFSGY